jgi:cytochrome P450
MENLHSLVDLPVVGSYAEYEYNRLLFLSKCAREHGKVVRFKDFVYITTDADLCDQLLLRTHKDTVASPPNGTPGIDNTDIDISADKQSWRAHRTRLNEGLHQRVISAHYDQAVEIIYHHLDTWQTGKKFLLPKKLRPLICQLVLEHFFGPQGEEYVQLFDTYIHARLDFLNSPFSFPQWVPTPTSLRHKHSREKARAALKTLIRQRRQAPASQPDLLFHFMHTPDAQGHLYFDDELLMHLLTLIPLGIPNTVAALSWIWYLLASSPQQAARLYQERDAVVGQGVPTPEHLTRLPYLGAVIKEALRLYPPIWQLGRDVARPCTLHEYQCQPGQAFLIDLYHLHRDASAFADPETFLPERWLAETTATVPPRGSYLPFGSGPSKCPGERLATQEIMLIILLIAARFTLRIPDVHRIDIQPDIMIHPKNMHVIVERRV